MAISINVSGVWKDEPPPSINVAGVWKDPDVVSINVAGTWKDVYSGLSVSIDANGRTNFRFGSACYGGAYFLTTGVGYEYTATAGGSSVGNWLDSGTASDVWIQWVRTGGTLSAWNSINPGTGRLQMSSNRYYRAVRSTGGINTITGYFRAYDAASGGNLLDTGPTGTYSQEAEISACPTCCFTPDTLITMASGLEMPIGKIKTGDKILIKRPENAELAWEKVGEVITRTERRMYRIDFEDGTHLRASEDHPLSVEGKGYACINPSYEDYKDIVVRDTLSVGDPITTLSGGTSRIVKITEIDYPGVVITFSNSFWFANGKLVY